MVLALLCPVVPGPATTEAAAPAVIVFFFLINLLFGVCDT